jgi:hypothetical protein
MYDFWDYFFGWLLLAVFVLPLLAVVLIKIGFLFIGVLMTLSSATAPITRRRSEVREKCEEDY